MDRPGIFMLIPCTNSPFRSLFNRECVFLKNTHTVVYSSQNQ